jgi:hypothetical protein
MALCVCSRGYNAMTYPFTYPDCERPFAFEDLPVNANGKRIEPEKWGPVYTKPPAKPTHLRAYDPPTNAPSGQKGPVVDDAKFRAKLRAENTAIVNAARRAWADGKPRPAAFGKEETIVKAYEAAMTAKRARLAALEAVKAAIRPHYVLRAGKWQLKHAA